ncbi:MAG: lipoprotein [Oceanicoccus sp.]
MRAVSTATIIGILAGTLLLSGCGQKGPLYIPQQAIPQDNNSIESEGNTAVDPTETQASVTSDD